MYTWEKPFQNKVNDIRNEEIKRLIKFAVYAAVTILFSIHGPFIVSTVRRLIFTQYA